MLGFVPHSNLRAHGSAGVDDTNGAKANGRKLGIERNYKLYIARFDPIFPDPIFPTERHRRIATEGALLGSVLAHGISPDLAIVSDDAGQFNLLLHGLCWVHAEWLVHKLIPLNEAHRQDLAQVRSQIWSLYADLKAYKAQPSATARVELQERFDTLFTQKTRFATLN